MSTKADQSYSYTVEAGVTTKFTEELRKQLQGERVVTIHEDIRYDPKGIDIQLKVNPNDFKVKELTGGKQPPIVNGKSTIWSWEVTPLKQGSRTLTLTSVVAINVPELERSYIREYTIHKEMIDVEVNPGYSIQQFVANYWQPVLISVLAFLTGGFAWWRALQPRVDKNSTRFPQS